MAQPMSATAKPAGPSEPPLTPLSGMPKRIGVELLLLSFAGIAVFGFQLTIDLALTKETTTVTFLLPALIFGISLAAWATLRGLAPHADPLLVPIASFLSGIGIVFIRRLDRTATNVEPLPADAGVFAGSGGSQLIFLMIGVAVFALFLTLVRNHRILRGYAYILLFAGIGLAALPGFLPYSISGSDGSKNWIRLGGFSVQPSEFAKLMLLVFFAVYLVRKRDVLSVAGKKILGLQFPRIKDLGPILIVWGACLLLLIFERDLGTSLLLFAMFLSVLYVATRRASWIVIGLTLFIGGCVALYPFFSHLQVRVAIWLDPWNPNYVFGDGIEYPSSYQLVQGLAALNSGGLVGNGPGKGNPNLIPASESDFILAALGEEIGLIGLIAILLMYVLLVQRGFKAGIMCRDLFGKLLAGGLAFLVAFQLFVVAGGVTGLIPMTGQTTPFLAAGGSSLVGSWLLVAMFARVSDDARKPWQASYGLQKTEAPPEFLAEQAAKRAAEAAAAGVVDDGPVPGGDQPTELIIPSALRGGAEPGSQTAAGTEQDLPARGGPQSPPSPPTSQQPGGPQSPPSPPTNQQPGGPQSPPPPPPTPNSAYGSPPRTAGPPPPPPPTNQQPGGPQSPPPPPNSAFEYRPQPPASGDDRNGGHA